MLQWFYEVLQKLRESIFVHYLVTFFEIIEEKVGVRNIENELFHFLSQMEKVVAIF